MQGPTSHLYFSQRLRLHYVTWGNEGAPSLLLIHGGRDHCRNWDWVAERLADRYHIVAPDLRGHGDSEWATGASYNEVNYVYDIAQLVLQKKMAPVTIIAHSLGGSIALLYSGLFPETVAKVVAIEGLGPSPEMLGRIRSMTIEQRVRSWIEMRREAAGRVARKYATFEDAVKRMKEENAHLDDAQARHLTLHGAVQNEDGTYSWKFDNFVRMGGGPAGLSNAREPVPGFLTFPSETARLSARLQTAGEMRLFSRKAIRRRCRCARILIAPMSRLTAVSRS